MHSSRMRTGRSLTVCRSLLPGGVSAQGGVCSGGVSALGSVCSEGCVCSGGVCSGGCLLGGVYSGGLLRGGCLLWGVSAPGGVVWYPSMHWSRQPPSVNRMTNRCKNITLATTSLRPVKRLKWENVNCFLQFHRCVWHSRNYLHMLWRNTSFCDGIYFKNFIHIMTEPFRNDRAFSYLISVSCSLGVDSY